MNNSHDKTNTDQPSQTSSTVEEEQNSEDDDYRIYEVTVENDAEVPPATSEATDSVINSPERTAIVDDEKTKASALQETHESANNDGHTTENAGNTRDTIDKGEKVIKVGKKGARSMPSVYSNAEISRHRKRLKLKALSENSDSEESVVEAESENRNLDVNLRIFEETATDSTGNVIRGEIQCNVEDQTKDGNVGSKNTNVFKLSVNTNVLEKECAEDESQKSDDDNSLILSSLSDDSLFSDEDSDLDILMISKPIIKKRAPMSTTTRQKITKKDGETTTMKDLIYDSFSKQLSKKTDASKSNSTEKQVNTRKKSSEKASSENRKTTKSSKTDKTPEIAKKSNESNSTDKVDEMSSSSESIPKSKKKRESMAVPQLKVGADGQVIIDMDSLIVEQTGLAEAREAIANSEVIEETGYHHTPYRKNCQYRKQWTPHDTLKFYNVLSTIGTDFTLMATLFPGRTRNCIKRKFKREERANADLILKALTSRQNFDIAMLERELKLKDDKVNRLRKSKKQKIEVEKKKVTKEKKEKKEEKKRGKRQSFFEKGISCFQSSS